MNEQAHRPTSRVLDILEALVSSEEGLSLSQIAEAVDAPKSSLFPYVHTLSDRRYIEQNRENGKYRISLNAFALAASYQETHGLYRLVTEAMRRVVEECSEVCQLGILEGPMVLYIGKADAPEMIRLVSHIGKRLPASCTALGKALLCEYSEDELRVLYNGELPALTDRSIRDFAVLAAQGKAIREGGFAREEGESHEHIVCYALPLFFRGKVNAALSVSIPVFRSTEEKGRTICQSLSRARAFIERCMEEAGEGLKMEG
jgi:DNA-binding IclR family transcriptional regulator